ncbi:MAG: helix-turn-helix domain-containing protein, partial [Kiritimatiellae bacterium]|nr:helix-turn-helix domain-containing protein [Kiritimatiellia bacterium]
RDDIAPLVARFMEEFSAGGGRHVAGIEPAALKALEDYSWPGNVRQLRNVVEKMVILANGERLTADDLPVEITAPRAPAQPAAPETESHAPAAPAPADTPPAELSLHEAEKRQILAALAAAKYNKTKAAAALGISRRTLHRKLREWNGES